MNGRQLCESPLCTNQAVSLAPLVEDGPTLFLCEHHAPAGSVVRR